MSGLTSPSAKVRVVDVGSMGGLEPEWARCRELIEAYGFEPDARAAADIDAAAFDRVFPVALSNQAREIEFFVTRDQGKSSTLRPNHELLRAFPDVERFEVIETVRLGKDRVSTIDALVADGSLPLPDFIKLDTQGSELSILEGARDSISNVLGLKIEVEFLQLYAGQPLFHEVHAAVSRAGFELFDLRRMFWRRVNDQHGRGRGQLAFGDALYLRPEQQVVALAIDSDESAGHVVARAAMVAAVYGYWDYVRLLLSHAVEAGILASISIPSWASMDGVPGAPSRPVRLLRQALLKVGALADRFEGKASHWATGDGRLGNRRPPLR